MSQTAIVLIVDDEPDLRDIVVFELQEAGFKTDVAASGDEAFEKLSRQHYDAVVTDVRMPHGTGIELLDKIKKSGKPMPVVFFMTGFADISLDDAYERGAHAIFTKPVDYQAMILALKNALHPPEARWKRSYDRFDVKFHITMNVGKSQRLVTGDTVNIGRGGAFLSLKDRFPRLNDNISFNIKFEDTNYSEIKGIGICRWVRKSKPPKDGDGVGIEFTYIDPETYPNLLAILGELKTGAYIPKK